jgi:hypothetical protein
MAIPTDDYTPQSVKITCHDSGDDETVTVTLALAGPSANDDLIAGIVSAVHDQMAISWPETTITTAYLYSGVVSA